MIPHATASANILRHVETGTLIQGAWHRRRGGVELACLLGSIDPSVKTTQDCNAELMPLWLAETSLVLFDGLPRGSIGPVARRYGTLIAQWHVLVPIRWDAILMRFLIRAIDDAVDAARPTNERKDYWPAVEAACVQTKEAITSGGQDRRRRGRRRRRRGRRGRRLDRRRGRRRRRRGRRRRRLGRRRRRLGRRQGRRLGRRRGRRRRRQGRRGRRRGRRRRRRAAADAAAWAAGAAAWAAAGAAWAANARAADGAAGAAAGAAARAAACERLFMFLLDQIEAEIGSAS